MMAHLDFNGKSCDLPPLSVTHLSKCQPRGPENGTLFCFLLLFLFFQIANKMPEINETERKLRPERLLFLALFWTPYSWRRAADWPLEWQEAGLEHRFLPAASPAFLSFPTRSTLSSSPWAAGGSWGTESLEVEGRKLLSRSGFSQTVGGAWRIEAVAFLSHAEEWSRDCEVELSQQGSSTQERKRKESRQIEITRCPCLAVI